MKVVWQNTVGLAGKWQNNYLYLLCRWLFLTLSGALTLALLQWCRIIRIAAAIGALFYSEPCWILLRIVWDLRIMQVVFALQREIMLSMLLLKMQNAFAGFELSWFELNKDDWISRALSRFMNGSQEHAGHYRDPTEHLFVCVIATFPLANRFWVRGSEKEAREKYLHNLKPWNLQLKDMASEWSKFRFELSGDEGERLTSNRQKEKEKGRGRGKGNRDCLSEKKGGRERKNIPSAEINFNSCQTFFHH